MDCVSPDGFPVVDPDGNFDSLFGLVFSLILLGPYIRALDEQRDSSGV